MNQINERSKPAKYSLYNLRKIKRDLVYDARDFWRTLTQKDELEKVINQREIRLIGLKRSGNHAVLNWIRGQEQDAYFLNNVGVSTSPFRHFHLHFPQKNFREEAWGKFKHKNCFLYSYEDHSIAKITEPKYEKKHDLYVGKSNYRYDVLILRDPFNLMASRLKKGFLSVKTQGMSLVDMWIEYAKEFIGETSYLNNKKVVVNYNQWFADISYRQKIAANLDLEFSDVGLNYVSSYGGGSSFEQQNLSGNAQEMDVTNRWKLFLDNNEFLTLIKNDELLYYSEKIFGTLPDTELIYKR
jgi:hypothetical protein